VLHLSPQLQHRPLLSTLANRHQPQPVGKNDSGKLSSQTVTLSLLLKRILTREVPTLILQCQKPLQLRFTGTLFQPLSLSQGKYFVGWNFLMGEEVFPLALLAPFQSTLASLQMKSTEILQGKVCAQNLVFRVHHPLPQTAQGLIQFRVSQILIRNTVPFSMFQRQQSKWKILMFLNQKIMDLMWMTVWFLRLIIM